MVMQFGAPLGLVPTDARRFGADKGGLARCIPCLLIGIEAAVKIPRLTLDIEPGMSESSNVSHGPPIRRMVPLVSWVSAGQWRECDVREEPMAWIPVTFAALLGRQLQFALFRCDADALLPVVLLCAHPVLLRCGYA